MPCTFAVSEETRFVYFVSFGTIAFAPPVFARALGLGLAL